MLVHDFDLGDFNLDGFPDAFAAGEGIAVMVGNGAGSFQAASPAGIRYWEGAGSLAAADFNHDGNVDVAATLENIEIILGRGDGSFQKGYFVPSGLSGGWLTTVDLNRDGNVDLVVSAGDISILLGKGDGSFQLPRTYRLGVAGKISSGDFNGDGIPDLAAAGYDGPGAVLLGLGDGSFNVRSLGVTHTY